MVVTTGYFQLIYRFDLGYKSSITLKIPRVKDFTQKAIMPNSSANASNSVAI